MIYYSILLVTLFSFSTPVSDEIIENNFASEAAKVQILLDTDANNELDDQHAMAYMLLSGLHFDVAGITVNATFGGGDISNHYEEARRILLLCGLNRKIPILKGANRGFETLYPLISQHRFEGSEAVEFIVSSAIASVSQPLVVLAIGKLTNVALALARDPSISSRIRVVWLGSNYPEPGEYNLINDIAALNYILSLDVPFEIVTVRSQGQGGSHEVQVSVEKIQKIMPGLGPSSMAVTGRHGGVFNNFGDYSVNLFEHSRPHGNTSHRPLYDVASVAILKNPAWGQSYVVRGIGYGDNGWTNNPESKREVVVWENFDAQSIISDFFSSMQNPIPVRVTKDP